MPAASRKVVCALSIGGTDPGGGAGLLADARAFAAAGVLACGAVAVVTVQSTRGLVSARALPASEVRAQAEAVLAAQRVRALKTGALGSADNVVAVAGLSADYPHVPVVVDPVMLPSRGGARLLRERAIAKLRDVLVPRATLVTANVSEAEALTGLAVRTVDEAERAASAMCALGARAALVKGGHLEGPFAEDVFVFGRCRSPRVVRLRARRLDRGPLHGTGCTLAALIAGRLADASKDAPRARLPDDDMLVSAVQWAKRRQHRAIDAALDAGGPLRLLWPRA